MVAKGIRGKVFGVQSLSLFSKLATTQAVTLKDSVLN
jgi:hypothetical protein